MSTPPTLPPASISKTQDPISEAGPTLAVDPVITTVAPGEDDAPLEVADDDDSSTHGDSAFSDAGGSSTTSVADSIRDYRKLYGRTYHSYGDTEYWGPNDEKQNEQLDIGHHMFYLLFDNRISIAPITSTPQKVLDVGTGTGIWAIDFADAYPSATVIGTELSPIQPTWVPPNVSFHIDDAQLLWTFPENDFDLIHIRMLMGSIADWTALYENAFRCTKPNGWFEHVEYDIAIASDDGTVGPGHIMYEWPQTFIDAGEKMGRSFVVGQKAKQRMEEAGFVDVVERVWKLPCSGWASDPKMKECGRWQLLYLSTGLEGMALYILANVLKWEYTAIQAYIGQMKAALLDTSNHGYNRIICVYGRKPGPDEVPKAAAS